MVFLGKGGGGLGIDKSINGKIQSFEFEVRIFLDQKILRVASLPNYAQMVELDDPNKIKSNTDYRFFIKIAYPGHMLEITEIIESDSFENTIF